MRRLLILSFLFCLLSLTQSVNAAPNTITKTELDLKLELQKKDIDANKEQTAETKAFIKEELNKQKEYNIDSRRYISDKVEIINWQMTFYGIVVSVIGLIIAIFAGYSTWKVDTSEREVKKSINRITETAEESEKKMMKDLEAISVMKKDIEKTQIKVNECLTQIRVNTDISNRLVNLAYKNSNKQSIDSNDEKQKQDEKEITEYVSALNKSKPESELTANDWLLKGYDAYLKKDFESACFYYKKASQLGGNSANLFNLWGNALSKLADQKKDENLYLDAISKYEKSIELESKNTDVYYNWGTTLSILADLKRDENLYLDAISKFEKSIELDSKNANAYNNLGNTLGKLANQKNDESLYFKAISKYEKTVELDLIDAKVYSNWGNALWKLAKLKNDEELYSKAISMYDRSLELDPNDEITYSNLSAVSMEHYNLTNTLEQNKKKIEDLLYKAESIKEGGGSYNFACLYSLLNDKDKAFEWLDKNLKNKESRLSREIIEKEKDFDSIKGDPRFVALLNRYYPQ